jgi:hypothetical protein
MSNKSALGTKLTFPLLPLFLWGFFEVRAAFFLMLFCVFEKVREAIL